ncbi:MAG TPA: hypothetical protein VME44_10325 [Streptosporangiaceae bacterium]|nr:hypothetical protein [Streptosporangiaceae bacterium]
MNTLERHCRFLLRAYPAAYRELRGEEIIGTLLEATTPGRSWPRLRDIRGLAFSGLRAHAMFNRQLTTRANLRIAVLAGVAACLAYSAASFVSVDVMDWTNGNTQPAPFGWPNLLASALTLLAVGLALLTGRRAVVLGAVIPAAAVVCYVGPWDPGTGATTAAHLVFLAALVALAGGSKRPSRGWLLPVGLLTVLPLLPDIGPQFGPVLFGVLLLAVVAVSIAWAVIDARPAIAMSVLFLALWLPAAVNDLMLGLGPAMTIVPALVIATIVGVAALWLLRRQSAHPGRLTRE